MHSKTILIYGGFAFKPATGSFEQVQRRVGQKYAKLDRIGRSSAVQHIAPKNEEMTLSGTWWPNYQRSWNFEQLRAQAALGVPLPLVSGSGRCFGLFFMEDLNLTSSYWDRSAREQKQDFSLKLYEWGLDNVLTIGGLF